MKKTVKKLLSLSLAALLIIGTLPFAFADSMVEIYLDGAEVTDRISLQEYRSVTLTASVAESAPEGSYVSWKSNLPLLADVDDSGKVTAYDYSKGAIIQLWIDENIATLPLVGEATADAIWKAIDDSGIDIDTADTDTIIIIVSAIVGEALGESLRTYLNNMNVKITATLSDENGTALGSDTVEVLVEKSVVASVAPTGVHITNKRVVPLTVAIGASVQLYGACTPVRLKQSIKWSVGKNAFDTSAGDYASVTADGLVTFKKAGTVTVRVNPESTLYAAFSDTVTFTVLEPEYLPVKDFTITGSSSVQEGATTRLAISGLTPAGAYSGDLTWTSSDPSIAAVDSNGTVTGLDGGSGLTYSRSVNINATVGGVTKAFTIKVTRQVVSTLSSVDIIGYSTIGIGSSELFSADVFPARLNTSSAVTREWGLYDSANDTVMFAAAGSPVSDGFTTMDSSGNLTGIASGVSTVYCRATYGNSTVYDSVVVTCGKAITDFTISGTLSLTECATSQLSVSVISPSDYDQNLLHNVKWSIDDSTVATVSGDGILFARDAGGRALTASRTATVTAVISGVTKTATVTVKGQGTLSINKYSDAQINGSDVVIVDLPTGYSMTSYPSRIGSSASGWGMADDDGNAPWTASITTDVASANRLNSKAEISAEGVLSGKTAGKTTIYCYMRNLASTFIEQHKDVDVIELAPESITLTAPAKYEYSEGDSELNLDGLKVLLKYNKNDVTAYYPDAASYTEAELTAEITDYSVSEIDNSILDTEQYIVVSVTRAGKVMRAVFPILLKSKEVESLSLVNPQKSEYAEGDTELDLTGLEVTANYSNAESEAVTGYTVDTSAFNPSLFDTVQQIPVTYTHAGRSATAFFPVTVYGKPVITVTPSGTLGKWTGELISFALSATHDVGGIKYYYSTSDNPSWILIPSSTHSVTASVDETICFKAVNGKGLESEISDGFHVMYDSTRPYFFLRVSNTSFTNESVTATVNNIRTGKSGVESLTVDGKDIYPQTSFLITENGSHTVILTSGNGYTYTVTADITNIDSDAPAITAATVSPFAEDGFCREPETGTVKKYFNSSVSLSITAQDFGVSGVSAIYYRTVDKDLNPVGEWQTYTEGAVFFENGFIGAFECKATDNAGNESGTVYSDIFMIDSDAPLINEVEALSSGEPYEGGSWASDSVVFTPKCFAESGIYECLYSVDDGEWTELASAFLEVTEDGTHTYRFKAVSMSGLVSEISSFTIHIDRTVPAIRVDFEGTFGRWTSDNVTFTLSTLSESPSGITYYYDCGEGWLPVDGSVVSFSENTDAYYRFKAINGSGHESNNSDSYLVKIDTEKPTAYIVSSVTETTSSPYTVTVIPVCGKSGIRKVYFNGEDITETLTATVTHNGKFILTVIGNNLLSDTSIVEISNFGFVSDKLYDYSSISENTSAITSYNGKDESVTVPFTLGDKTVTVLKSGAFRDNTALTSVYLPNGLLEIEDLCFMGDTALTTVKIPSTVTKIGDYAFYGCENVTILCYRNSAAWAFAEANGIAYMLLNFDPVGKTDIDLEAHRVFTESQSLGSPDELIKTESLYTAIGIPTLISGDTSYYGTGSLIYYFYSGKLSDTFTVIVRGDVNGDSVVDVFDIMVTELAANGNLYLFNEALLAADYDQSNEVEVADFQETVNRALSK